MAKNNRVQPKQDGVIFFTRPWKVFVIEILLFLIIFVLGISTSMKINQILEIRKIRMPQASFWRFVYHFLIVTLLVFLIIRLIKFKKQKRIIFKILFVFTVFWGGILLLSVWIPDLIAVIAMSVLVFWWWRWPSVFIQDVCVVLGIVGISSLLGLSFNPETVIFFLIVFSIYDVIAVYKTKHMIEIAKEMISSKAILALVVPSNASGLREGLEGIMVRGKFLILGGGDIAFPLLLCCSMVPFGLLKSVIVALFSLIGLSASFWIFILQKKQKPIPALPPVALLSILGYLFAGLF